MNLKTKRGIVQYAVAINTLFIATIALFLFPNVSANLDNTLVASGLLGTCVFMADILLFLSWRQVSRVEKAKAKYNLHSYFKG
jgi:hypothetical protein